MRLILWPFAWWSNRAIRCARADVRRGTFYAMRAERTLVAAGLLPMERTLSGVPVMAKLPPRP